jgi:hypothetical protein
MTDHAVLVRRALSAETAGEFDRRVDEQGRRLTDAIEAGTFDNDAVTVGLELELYAVDGDGRLAELPADVFEGPAAKELGVHNAELNTAPSRLDDDGIRDQAEAIAAGLAATRERAREHGLDVVLDAMWTVPPAGGTDAYLDDITVDRGGATDEWDSGEDSDRGDASGESDDSGVGDTSSVDGTDDGGRSAGADRSRVVPGSGEGDPVVFARNMRQDPRYTALDNAALGRAGGVLDLSVPGGERSFRTILFESLATSIQPHVQVPDASAFPRYHNLAVRTLGPVLALATNSPFLPADCYDADPERVVEEGHHELRVAAFEQAMNRGFRKVRVPADLDAATDAVDHVVADDTYGPFLHEWLDEEADAEDSGGDDTGVDPAEGDGEASDREASSADDTGLGDCWEFEYKRGSFWRWVRGVARGDAVEGACDERSLRVEYRPLPTQPTVRDVVGFQVLTAGLLHGLAAADHPLCELPWDDAERSFYAAVKDGLAADLAWVTADGEYTTDSDAVFAEVFAHARRGLDDQGVSRSVRERYLDPLEARWERGTTPSMWKRRRVRAALADGADLAGALARMQREYAALSREHETFVDWL